MQPYHVNPGGHDDPEGGGALAGALTPAERELERALGALHPAPPALPRERLLFDAGRAAGEAAAGRRLLAWRAAAAVLLVGLGLSVVMRGGPRVVERDRFVYLPAPAEAATPDFAGTVGVPDEPPQEWPAPHDRGLLASPRQPLMPSAGADYVTVRDAVLRWGVRAMPSQPDRGGAESPAPAPTANGLLGIPAPEPRRGWRTIDFKGLILGDRL
jgi:hypothetical protein